MSNLPSKSPERSAATFFIFLDNGGGIHQPRVAEVAHDELDIRMADGGFIEGQRMAVFDECFGTGGLSGVDGNRLLYALARS